MASTLAPHTARPAPPGRLGPPAGAGASARPGRPLRPDQAPPSRSWLWVPALVAAIPALAVAAVELAHLGTPSTPGADWALLARDTERALGGDALVGPYSRFGWNHPGPALSYWLAPFWWLSGRNFGGLGLGAAVLSAITMASMVVATGRAAELVARPAADPTAGGAGPDTDESATPAERTAEWRSAWVSAGILVAFAFAYGPGRLREPWNPAMVILPIAAVAVFGAAVAAGRRWWLPAWALAASFAIQSHVGSIPVVATLLLVTWVLGTWRNRETIGRFVAPLLAALALTAVLWAPPIHQQAARTNGNLADVVDFFRYTPTAEHSWGEVRPPLESLAPLTLPRFGSLIGGQEPTTASPGPVERVTVVVLGIGLVAGVVSAGRRRNGFRLVLAGATLAAVPATIFAALRVQDAVFPYLVFYAVSIGLLAWLSLALTVADEAAAWWSREQAQRAMLRRWHPATALAGPGLVVLAALMIGVNAIDTPPSAEVRDEPVAAALSADARLALRTDGDVRRVVVDMGPGGWGAATAIVTDLEAHGYDVTVDKSWVYVFGQDSRTDGDEQRRLVVTAASDGRYPAQPEDRPIARRDGLTLYYGDP